MTRHIVLRQPQPSLRRHPLLSRDTPSTSAKFAEVAGGTAAECAAVCCCCPCGIVNLFVVAVIKLPAGLCRRAIVSSLRKKRAKKLGLLQKKRTDDMDIIQILPPDSLGWWTPEKSPSAVVSDMEREMLEKFYSAGFWRNPSGREKVEAGNGEKAYD